MDSLGIPLAALLGIILSLDIKRGNANSIIEIANSSITWLKSTALLFEYPDFARNMYSFILLYKIKNKRRIC